MKKAITGTPHSFIYSFIYFNYDDDDDDDDCIFCLRYILIHVFNQFHLSFFLSSFLSFEMKPNVAKLSFVCLLWSIVRRVLQAAAYEAHAEGGEQERRGETKEPHAVHPRR